MLWQREKTVLIEILQMQINLSALLSALLSVPPPVCPSLPACFPVCAPPQVSSSVPTGGGALVGAGGATDCLTAQTTQTRLAAMCHLEAASIAATTAPTASPTLSCAMERWTAPTTRMSAAVVRDVSWC